jgi:hypothetical protein
VPTAATSVVCAWIAIDYFSATNRAAKAQSAVSTLDLVTNNTCDATMPTAASVELITLVRV